MKEYRGVKKRKMEGKEREQKGMEESKREGRRTKENKKGDRE